MQDAADPPILAAPLPVVPMPPFDPRRLVGRDPLLDAIDRALEAGERLLVLRGPPGVGKSSLARCVAARRRSSGGSAVHAVLDGCTDRASVLASLATAAGVAAVSTDARALLGALADALDAKHSLLVVDGLDAASEVTAAVLSDLLDGADAVSVVACAWRRLGLPDERVVPVPPLDADDAASLLTDRVARLAPARLPTPPEASAIVGRVGGLPLALELVAARVAALGPAAVLDALHTHGLHADALDRSLDAAWQLLRPSDRDALTALAAFRGRFDADDAVAMIGGPDALDALERLVAASLVSAHDDDGAARFVLLDSVRDHAARRCRDTSAQAARHAAVFTRAPALRPDDASAWRRLDRERDDLLAAWRWSIAHDPPRAVRLALRLDPLLLTQGPASLHRRVLDETLRAHAASVDDPLARVDLLLALGRFDLIRGNARAALRPLREALASTACCDDPARRAHAALFTCYALRPLGAFDEALSLLREVVPIAEALRDHRLAGLCAQCDGIVAFAADAPKEALAAYDRALASARLAGAPRLEGIVLANVTHAHLALGDLASARASCDASRACFVTSDDRFHMARVEILEGRIDAAASLPDRAEPRLLRALDVVLEHDDLQGELEARLGLLVVARARGDEALATRRFEALAAAARFTDDQIWPPILEKHRAPSGPRAHRPPSLALSRGGRSLELGASRHDLTRRGPLRRVLVALVAAHLDGPRRSLSAAEVQAAGWPGEKMFAESGAARVYMAIRRLRQLGLEALLITSDAGYALDPEADVRWLDAP